MSSIKPKFGACCDCPPDAPHKYLNAGRCDFHYKMHRFNVNKEKKHNKEKKAFKADLSVYFASQILEIPPKCENCKTDISWQRKSHFARNLVAHILPKRKVGGFPTVATHPKNRVFLCGDCHSDYDNKGADFAPTMACFPLICERFLEFESLLTESDKQRLPFYFKDLLNIKH